MQKLSYSKKTCLILCTSLFIALFFFIMQFNLDNKYQVRDSMGVLGVLDLRTGSGDTAQQLHQLTYGWEAYPQKLLGPGEFANQSPYYVYIGEYSGFEIAGDTPHGCITYRLRILLPQEPDIYYLELPELYTASRVYVNDTLLASGGNMAYESFTPCIQNKVISFSAAKEAEIIIQVADYVHYYSGMIYPPAFGGIGVLNLVYFRIIRSLCMGMTGLILGIIFLCLALCPPKKPVRFLLFSGFCFCYAIYISYPIIHQFFTGIWAYRLEDFFYYTMLLFLALLQNILCDVPRKNNRILLVCGLVIAVGSLVVPSFILGSHVEFMLLYSTILTAYQYFLTGYLIVNGLIAVFRNQLPVFPVLIGICIFALGLFCQFFFFPFEPIFLGWQTDIAGFVLLLLLAFVSGRDLLAMTTAYARLSKERQSMEIHLLLQTQNYHQMVQHTEQIRRMQHDLKHHLHIMNSFAQKKDFEELTHYLLEMTNDSGKVEALTLCTNPVINSLLSYYHEQALQKEIPFSIDVVLPLQLTIEPVELGILFGNLLENAFHASLKLDAQKRWVKVHASINRGHLQCCISNAYYGVLLMENGRYLSTRGQGHGIGLESVSALVEKYNGILSISSENQVFEVRILL